MMPEDIPEAAKETRKKARYFYGWKIVGASFLAHLSYAEFAGKMFSVNGDLVFNTDLSCSAGTNRRYTCTKIYQAVSVEDLSCRIFIHCGEYTQMWHHEDAVHRQKRDALGLERIYEHCRALASPGCMREYTPTTHKQIKFEL